MAAMEQERTLEETFGVSAALVTPFGEELSIDRGRMIEQARRVLDQGCASVTLFGTTGEGASLAEGERNSVLQAFVAAGIDPSRLVVGLNCTSSGAAIDQASAALDAGVRTLLVPPPFFFKSVSEEGVFAWYAALLDRIGHGAQRVLLYHIPQVTAVPLSLALVRRLKQHHGDLILGVKDSAGHWPTTEQFLGEKDLWVLVGDERHLGRAVRLGGKGAISGMANVYPRELAELVATGLDMPWLTELVDTVVKLPVTPAVKALVGVKRGEDGWGRVRAPLDATPAADIEALKLLLDSLKRAA
jgi:4-hydroxy-tetrahydrodipicolinate synthase